MIFGEENTFNYYSVNDETFTTKIQKQNLFGNDDNFTYFPAETVNQSTIFGDNDNFVCSLASQINCKIPFGNINDFLNLNNYEQCNFTTIESFGDCGRIDIGNNYGAYEINRDCGWNDRFYKRYCPCNDDNKNDCYKPCDDKHNKCNNYCNDKHCLNDCEKHNCDRQNDLAEKLSRKIYLQFIEVSKNLSCLIKFTNCPFKEKQLYKCNIDIDKLILSSLALSKAICFCEPIKANDFDEECRYDILFAKILTNMSYIIEDLVKLQNIVNNKVICASVLLLLSQTISVNNNLLQIACYNN